MPGDGGDYATAPGKHRQQVLQMQLQLLSLSITQCGAEQRRPFSTLFPRLLKAEWL
jgi:hypothetical protein